MIIVRESEEKIAARDERDCNWNLGCDCHAWILKAIHAASDEFSDWLFPRSEPWDLDLKFFIGGSSGIEAKIFRPDAPGQPEEPFGNRTKDSA